MTSASAPAAEACRFEVVETERRTLQRRLTCVACERPLKGRQSKWCSKDCSRLYGQNHYWTEARAAALLRDGRICRRCKAGPGKAPLLTALLIVLMPASGLSLTDVEFWLWRSHPDEAAACEATSLEVNHVRPRRGKGYGSGCHHHLENLEVLCHQCHVDVTVAQRRGYRGAGADLAVLSEAVPLSA